MNYGELFLVKMTSELENERKCEQETSQTHRRVRKCLHLSQESWICLRNVELLQLVGVTMYSRT